MKQTRKLSTMTLVSKAVFLNRCTATLWWGSSINDVMAIGGGSQGFRDDSTQTLVIKRVTMGQGVQKCMTSFIDDP